MRKKTKMSFRVVFVIIGYSYYYKYLKLQLYIKLLKSI